MKKTGRKRTFSTVKAVKGNARTVVGQPPPARIFKEKTQAAAQAKHKPSLAQTLLHNDHEGEP